MSSFTKYYHDFPRLARESGFAFHLRSGRVNWNEIDDLNLDALIEDRDFSLLEKNLNNVANCNLKREYDTKVLDKNFVKIFKLAQLGIDYLSYCEMYLDRCIILLQEQLTNSQEEVRKLREENQKLKMKKKPRSTSRESYQCSECSKSFISDVYLTAHEKRRHHPEKTFMTQADIPGEVKPTKTDQSCQTFDQKENVIDKEPKTETQEGQNDKQSKTVDDDKIKDLYLHIVELKDRLKSTEKLIEEKSNQFVYPATGSVISFVPYWPSQTLTQPVTTPPIHQPVEETVKETQKVFGSVITAEPKEPVKIVTEAPRRVSPVITQEAIQPMKMVREAPSRVSPVIKQEAIQPVKIVREVAQNLVRPVSPEKEKLVKKTAESQNLVKGELGLETVRPFEVEEELLRTEKATNKEDFLTELMTTNDKSFTLMKQRDRLVGVEAKKSDKRVEVGDDKDKIVHDLIKLSSDDSEASSILKTNTDTVTKHDISGNDEIIGKSIVKEHPDAVKTQPKKIERQSQPVNLTGNVILEEARPVPFPRKHRRAFSASGGSLMTEKSESNATSKESLVEAFVYDSSDEDKIPSAESGGTRERKFGTVKLYDRDSKIVETEENVRKPKTSIFKKFVERAKEKTSPSLQDMSKNMRRSLNNLYDTVSGNTVKEKEVAVEDDDLAARLKIISKMNQRFKHLTLDKDLKPQTDGSDQNEKKINSRTTSNLSSFRESFGKKIQKITARKSKDKNKASAINISDSVAKAVNVDDVALELTNEYLKQTRSEETPAVETKTVLYEKSDVDKGMYDLESESASEISDFELPVKKPKQFIPSASNNFPEILKVDVAVDKQKKLEKDQTDLSIFQAGRKSGPPTLIKQKSVQVEDVIDIKLVSTDDSSSGESDDSDFENKFLKEFDVSLGTTKNESLDLQGFRRQGQSSILKGAQSRSGGNVTNKKVLFADHPETQSESSQETAKGATEKNTKTEMNKKKNTDDSWSDDSDWDIVLT